MEKYTINSLAEYTETICKLDVCDTVDELIRRDVYLFRGHSKTSYKIEPSIARCGDRNLDLCFKERDMIEMAKFRFPDVFRNDLEPVELLALLQHHGIPTRLMDVTENALVALFFACISNERDDGEVIVFHNKEHGVANYPIINAIADSYRFSKGSFYSLEMFYGEVKRLPYFLEHATYDTDEEGGRWIGECCKNPIFIYTAYRSQRQRNQNGRYVLFPNKIQEIDKDKAGVFFSYIEPIPQDHECISMIIQIPASCKGEILKRLRLLGITKGSLFSDNIDIVCKEIVDIYSKKGRGNVNYI